MKTIALFGGGDWEDASIALLDIPDDMDVEEMKTRWRVWYEEFYCPNYKVGKKPKFKTVVDLMLEHGAKRADIEEFDED